MGSLAQKLAPRPEDADIAVGPEGSFRFTPSPAASTPNPGVIGLCIANPIAFVETLIALDGHVAHLVLLSHALPSETVSILLKNVGCTELVTDRTDLTIQLPLSTPQEAVEGLPGTPCKTKWTLTTSGTTGLPKLIPHTLNSLTRTVARGNPLQQPRWGLLYDPTRFAGLQVVLQALIGGGTLLTPDIHGAVAAQVGYLRKNGCTHLSATPTLWRRLLMAPGFTSLPLLQITLGGEIVDQQILDSLRVAHPKARITHIYASTEAGVGFAVTDEQAGFPTSYLQDGPAGIGMKIVDDVLWLRPPTSAQRALTGTDIMVDADGFIRSGDQIKITDNRALFLGRDNGTINVGGVKIHPEMVEQAIIRVEGVKLARITSKKSPIAGALVVAEVLAAPDTDTKVLKSAIQTHCKATLEREAVPAIIRFVDDLTLNAAGKLIRTDDPK